MPLKAGNAPKPLQESAGGAHCTGLVVEMVPLPLIILAVGVLLAIEPPHVAFDVMEGA